MKKTVIILGFFLIFFTLIWSEKSNIEEKNWPQWRGPYASGITFLGNPPVTWDEKTNVKWKIEIPGKGHATPIIWGDRIFILSAVETEKDVSQEKKNTKPQQFHRGPPTLKTTKIHKFVVLAINRKNGKILWQTAVKEELPQEGTHQFGSWASNSAVTDGKHIYAYFGSRGLFCLDFKGKVKWQRDFGQLEKRMNFGEGSSPVLFKDKIFITWDHEGPSFLFALDKKTGKDIWKVEREERTSWSTPRVVEHKGKAQLISSATKFVRSYDPDTGKVIWQCSGLTANVIPMPVTAKGIVYLSSGFRGNALLAIRLDAAKGDITGTDAIAWQYNKDTPYTPSPILLDNKLYMLKSNNGILTCLNATTGKAYYSKERLEGVGSIFTSLTGTRNHFYILGQKGVTYVIKYGPKFEVLAKNKLDDNFCASPAIVGDNLYLRGYKYLYCISKD